MERGEDRVGWKERGMCKIERCHCLSSSFSFSSLGTVEEGKRAPGAKERIEKKVDFLRRWGGGEEGREKEIANLLSEVEIDLLLLPEEEDRAIEKELLLSSSPCHLSWKGGCFFFFFFFSSFSMEERRRGMLCSFALPSSKVFHILLPHSGFSPALA